MGPSTRPATRLKLIFYGYRVWESIPWAANPGAMLSEPGTRLTGAPPMTRSSSPGDFRPRERFDTGRCHSRASVEVCRRASATRCSVATLGRRLQSEKCVAPIRIFRRRAKNGCSPSRGRVYAFASGFGPGRALDQASGQHTRPPNGSLMHVAVPFRHLRPSGERAERCGTRWSNSGARTNPFSSS